MGGLVKPRRSLSAAGTYVAPVRDEVFADSSQIVSTTLSYGVERPVKAAGNPLFTTSPTSKYDHHLVYATAVNAGGVIRQYNTVFTSDWTRARVASAYSTDGSTFTRPNVGLFTADSSTNNSIVLDTTASKVFGHVIYDPVNSPTYPYLCVGPDAESYPYYPTLWGSRDGAAFSVLKRLDAVQTNKEPWSLTRRSDGRWIVHYQSYPSSIRSVGAWLSDTTSLTGAWTDQGNILVCTDSLVQFYSFSSWRDGDVMFAMMNIFNGNNQVSASATNLDDRQYKMRLYTSRASDGLSSWTLLDDNWLEAGNSYGSDVLTDDGYPDWGCIKIGGAPVKTGSSHRFYYSASKERHHPYPSSTAGFIYQHTICAADLGYQRLTYLGGTGNAVLATATPTAGPTTVTVNSTGTVKIELLDGSNNVITGYAQTDCEALPSDASGHVVKWNGSSATPATAFRVKAYVTSGKVYRVTVK